MINSYYWKKDLFCCIYQIKKYNKVNLLSEKFDHTYHQIQRAIHFSAFICRKLVEDHKLTDDIDNYFLPTSMHLPIKEINRIWRIVDDEYYDIDNFQHKKIKAHDICNWLIHSYIMQLKLDFSNGVLEFWVSSDYTRNQKLYYISLNNWLLYLRKVRTSYMRHRSEKYDPQKRDFVILSKR